MPGLQLKYIMVKRNVVLSDHQSPSDHQSLSDTISYHQLSFIINHHQTISHYLSLVIISNHQAVSHHQSPLVLISHHQTISHYQLPSDIIRPSVSIIHHKLPSDHLSSVTLRPSFFISHHETISHQSWSVASVTTAASWGSNNAVSLTVLMFYHVLTVFSSLFIAPKLFSPSHFIYIYVEWLWRPAHLQPLMTFVYFRNNQQICLYIKMTWNKIELNKQTKKP